MQKKNADNAPNGKKEEKRKEEIDISKEIDISIVIPAYNEEENITHLFENTKKVLDKMKLAGKKIVYEIIFIDDGSKDSTFSELCKIKAELKEKDRKEKDRNIFRIIKFRKNFGQTAAMDAGFKVSRGSIIIPMDADLQNDPEDIPRLVEKLNEGYDVVCGWRKDRKDSLSKHIISRGANLLRKIILNDSIHDSGCTMKAYKKECFENLDLYGEMHRFIPAILEWRGFKVAEIPIAHHQRKFGKTKYSFGRIFRGFLDMIVVKFWMKYSARPIHLFGALGLATTFVGLIVGFYLTILKIFFGMSIGNRPLLLLSILLVVLGVQFIIFGLMSDILIKIYYKNNTIYCIEKII